MKKGLRLLLILVVLGSLVILLAKCKYLQGEEPVSETAFAGSKTCVSCHADIVSQYQNNPHHNTSHDVGTGVIAPADLADTTSFDLNQRLMLRVEKRNGRTYQVAYVDGKETISRPFDIAFGSGKKAYTYGYWTGKQLRQLPLSFYTTINKWANSPGFPTDRIYFERPIGSRCLECHASFIDQRFTKASGTSVTEEMERGSLIYGIDCERCHGPAGKHVQFHLDSPMVKQAKYMLRFAALTRQQKVDACAVCHSGNDVEQKKSTFAFRPGDKLGDYYDPGASALIARKHDVHGNHTQLMKKSACYIKSNSMTCNSCHNTHEDLKGSLKIYSERCISCHKTTNHSEKTLAKGILKENCIDCHMPNQASKLISFQTAGSGKASSYMLRTHHIAIYPNPPVN